jgi:hypothetical protein
LSFFPGLFIAFILSSMVRKNMLSNISTFTLSRKLIQRSEQGTKSLHELIQRPKQWLHFIPLASAVIYLSLSDWLKTQLMFTAFPQKPKIGIWRGKNWCSSPSYSELWSPGRASRVTSCSPQEHLCKHGLTIPSY